MIGDAWCFVVGKNSDLMTVYRGSCIIQPVLFVCYGSYLIQSSVPDPDPLSKGMALRLCWYGLATQGAG